MEITKRYYLRTVEGLNIRFALEADAWHAARLLNAMAEASDRCEADVYRFAFDEYVETVKSQLGAVSYTKDSLSLIFDPHLDRSSAAMFAVPVYHGCSAQVATKASRRDTHVAHAKTKWLKHRHEPLAFLR
jgi:hypothetical protein